MKSHKNIVLAYCKVCWLCRMWCCGVDITYLWLSTSTRLQWVQC